MSGLRRRDFIKGLIGGLIVGGALGYAGGFFSAPGKVKTVTVTETVTETVTPTVKPITPTGRKIRVGWIYVGPIGDYGWTYAHDKGRRYVERVFGDKIETMYIEAVKPAEALQAIESLIDQGVTLIFTTSFDFMDPTLEAAKKYPDIWFWHCSGYKRWRNMGTYFAELYQVYYLCGLAAGAVSKTLKFGYVAAHPIPEVIRHINSWVLGIKEALWHRVKRGELSWSDIEKMEVHVKWLFEWYNPPAAADAARSLVDQYDVDVLAFTEDSPAVLQVAEEYQAKGRRVWSYSHYSDMREYGPTAHLMGQLVDWGLMYEYIIAYYLSGAIRSMDLWWLMGDGADTIEGWKKGRGVAYFWKDEWGDFRAHPVIPDWAKELILERARLMKERYWDPWDGRFWAELFPEEGGIVDQDGNLRIGPGDTADRLNPEWKLGHDLLWSIDWFVKGIVEPVPKGYIKKYM